MPTGLTKDAGREGVRLWLGPFEGGWTACGEGVRVRPGTRSLTGSPNRRRPGGYAVPARPSR